MNERIKGLVYEAEKYALNKANDHDGDEDYENTFEDDFQQKFAESLIRECAHIAWLNSTEDNISHTVIKQHFGVEE